MSVSIKGELEIEVRDKEGRIKKIHKQPMRSFVRNFLRHLHIAFSSTNKICKDITGADCEVPHPKSGMAYFMNVYTDAGDYELGVVIGSGTTSPSLDDYNLESPYDNSVFDFSSVGFSEVDEPPYTILKISRTFTNISGETKTISEVGLIGMSYSVTHSSHRNFLLARDVLSSPITLMDGEAIIIRYCIKIQP